MRAFRRATSLIADFAGVVCLGFALWRGFSVPLGIGIAGLALVAVGWVMDRAS